MSGRHRNGIGIAKVVGGRSLAFPAWSVFFLQLSQHQFVGFAHQNALVHLHHAGAFLHEQRALHRIGNFGNARHNVAHHAAALHRVGSGFLHQQACFEQNEVFGLAVNVFRKGRCAYAGEVGIGVFAVGQQYNADVEVLLQHQIQSPQRGLDACGVAIV